MLNNVILKLSTFHDLSTHTTTVMLRDKILTQNGVISSNCQKKLNVLDKRNNICLLGTSFV